MRETASYQMNPGEFWMLQLPQSTSQGVRWIGLNVHAGNRAAERLYKRLGFVEEFVYEEAGFAEANLPSR